MSVSRVDRPGWVLRWGKRVGVPVGVALLVLGSVWFGLSNLMHNPPAAEPHWPTKLVEVPARSAGASVSAKAAQLLPDAAVVGVSFAGKHRAYPVAVMSDSISHVMNDRIAGQPFAVVYCDRLRCARGFTSADRKASLDLAVGGWLNEGGVNDLLVRHGKHRYQLKTGKAVEANAPPFPFEAVEVELTTWGEWRAAHPDTDVVPRLLPSGVAAQ
jgi:hypothetical protein